jgi:hypothetical protein
MNSSIALNAMRYVLAGVAQMGVPKHCGMEARFGPHAQAVRALHDGTT